MQWGPFFVGGGGYLGILTMLGSSGYRCGMSDNKPVISDEAVEAAADEMQQFCLTQDRDGVQAWQTYARIALEAAAPYIAAGAWDRGEQYGYARPRGKTRTPNPYRSQA